MTQLTRRLFLVRASAVAAAISGPTVATARANREFDPAALDAAFQRLGVVFYRNGRSGLCYHALDPQHEAAWAAGLFSSYEANRSAFRSYILARQQRPPSPLQVAA